MQHTVATEYRRPLALAFGGFIALIASMGIGRFIYTPILPLMVGDLGLSQGQAGLIASANFLGYLLGAIMTSAPRLPGSPRAWLLGSLAVSGATTFAMGLGSTMPAFFAFRFLGGMASAFVLVFASTLILERLAAMGRSSLAGVYFAGVSAGIMLTALIAAFLAGDDGAWRKLWWSGGILSLAIVLGVMALVPGDAAPRRDQEATTLPTGKVARRLWLLALAYGLFGFGYVITATFIVAMVRTSPGVTLWEPGVWLVVGATGIPSVTLWSMLARRIGAIRTFAVANLVEAVGVLASVVWPTNGGIMLAAAVLGATFMAIASLGLMAGRELAGRRARQVLGLLTVAFSIGQMVGPTAAGYAYDWSGSFTLPTLVAASALTIACALTIRLTDR
ncbi:MAG: YbfB/YjiJ family MFS transporter [Rhizobiales bacterium]|nr:YbfB/YjiJ family MFS transporter [Hyphomicrobiales bacterium]